MKHVLPRGEYAPGHVHPLKTVKRSDSGKRISDCREKMRIIPGALEWRPIFRGEVA